MSADVILSNKSLIDKMKKRGPKIDPCGICALQRQKTIPNFKTSKKNLNFIS